jgi:hypothetical protein
MGRWAAHYGGLVGQTGAASRPISRTAPAYVLAASAVVPFAITNNAGTRSASPTTRSRSPEQAPPPSGASTVNGIDYPVTWTSATNWTLTGRWPDVTNLLSLQAYDMRGRALANGLLDHRFQSRLLAPQPVVITS